MKTLTAYFSASGTTAGLATRMAEATSSDLFEIVPAQPYSDADLRWTNPVARCNREKIGKKDVPIANKVENWDQYEFILLGFPIWYFAAPNIIETFIKQYDWSGKKVALFATSGGSELGKTQARLEPLMNGTIIGAKLFHPNESVPALKAWAESLGE